MSVITPFKRVTSREIYGADISGLQDAVNRCEHVLTLSTAAVTGHILTSVSDQASPTLHRRIYEGTIRGWLESPAPVIRRAGVIVPLGEYTLYAAQGAVVFHAQQTAGVAITVDFTHVTNVSALTGHPAATTGVHGVGTSTVESAAGSQAKVDTHAAVATAHGATPTPTANRIMMWNGDRRAKVADGAAADDVATWGQVQTRVAKAGDTMTGPLDMDANTVRLRQPRTPASATAPGSVGEICWDADYIYVCVATDTWRRAALGVW